MGDEKDAKIVGTKATAAGAINIATTLATAALAPHHPELALVVGGVSAAGTSVITDRVGSMFAAAKEIEFGRLARGFKALLFGGPTAQDPAAADEQAQKVEARFKDPSFYANARELTRKFLDAMEEDAIEPLANLGRMYLLQERRVDPFYRSTARFIVEADALLLRSAADFVRRLQELIRQRTAALAQQTPEGEVAKVALAQGYGRRVDVVALDLQPGAAAGETELGDLDAEEDFNVLGAFAAASMGHPMVGQVHARRIYFLQDELDRLAIVFGIDDAVGG